LIGGCPNRLIPVRAEVRDHPGYRESPHRPTAIERRLSFRPAELGQRKLVKNSAMSFANSSGCSAAAKCPPLR
jgi:hypothetical protein